MNTTPLTSIPLMKKTRVLFLCVMNSSRSQMAEGLLRHIAGDAFEVESAGSEASSVRPEAVTVMDDIGIDISAQYSKSLEKFINDDFDYVITVCAPAEEQCPFFPNAKQRLSWHFEDPAAVQGTEAERLAIYTIVRSEIEEKIRTWLKSVRQASASNA